MTDYTACPNCGELHKIKQSHSQATRQEPKRFLGEFVLCTATAGQFGMDSFKAKTDDKRFEHRHRRES